MKISGVCACVPALVLVVTLGGCQRAPRVIVVYRVEGEGLANISFSDRDSEPTALKEVHLPFEQEVDMGRQPGAVLIANSTKPVKCIIRLGDKEASHSDRHTCYAKYEFPRRAE